MKITSDIKVPEPVVVPPPELKSITVEFTPREAYLLRRYLGPTSDSSIARVINDTKDIRTDKMPKSVLGGTTALECKSIGWNLFDGLGTKLEEAAALGVK